MSRDALVVGINCYQWEGLPNLRSPAKDAENIAQILENSGDFQVQRLPKFLNPFENHVPRIARNQDVTLEQLETALVRLFQSRAETALFFFSGHGLRKEGETYEGFLATSDVNPEAGKWGLSLKWLRQLLRDSPVRQQIVWLDCCHGGELFNFVEAEFAEYERFRLDPECLFFRDRCFIAASREFEAAYSGVLSPALLQGLDPTQQPDGWATNYSLEDWIKQTLKDIPQHIVCKNTGGQIILTGKSGVLGQICPYKGLNYFDFNDEDPKYFYGRTALIKQLLKRVQQSNFLAVLGSSGSGKSSVVRAGLLYQLKLGAIPGSDRWIIYHPFTPGAHPLKSLEQAIGADTLQLQSVIKANPAERVVLVVDQFEEVFTQCQDKTERQQFLEYLMGAVERGRNKLFLVLVMRSDFLGKCTEQEYAGLSKQIEQNLVTVLPMSHQAELREAITKPAEQVGLELDRELVNQMIADVAGSPGDLPLMQYTLTEMWEKRTLNRLTISDYTRLGGVKKALEKRANEVYQSLPEKDQLVAKRIFLELTRLGEATENTRRQVFLEDLVNSQQPQEQVERVVQCLANAKLLVTSEQELKSQRKAVVNIVHETLIRNWDLLVQWLEKNQVALLRKQDIEDVAKEWRDNQKRGESAYLLRGTRLAAAEDYLQRYADTLPLSKSAHKFVQKSIKHRRNSRIRLISTVMGVIGVLTGLTGIALNNARNANIQAVQAFTQTVEARLASNQPFDALLAAISAGRRLKDANLTNTELLHPTLAALLEATGRVKESNRLEGQKVAFLTTKFSPDGQMIAAVDRYGRVKLWQRNGEPIKSFDLHSVARGSFYQEAMNYDLLDFSPDGQKIVAVNVGIIEIWNRDGTPVNHITDGFVELTAVKFSPDGQLIASIGEGGLILLWHWQNNNTPIVIQGHQHDVNALKFSPDGQTIATASKDGTAKLWKLDGTLLATFSKHAVISAEELKWGEPSISVTDVEFSPNGHIIATANKDSTVTLWRRDGTLVTTLKASKDVDRESLYVADPSVKINNVEFSPDGRTIATAGNDRTVRLWKLDGNLLATLRGHEDGVKIVNFSPDGQIIASAADNGVVKLWQKNGTLLATFVGHTDWVRALDFSSDGKTIASASGDGTVKLWQLHDSPLTILKGHSVEFSQDGQTIATATGKGEIELRRLDGTPIITLEGDRVRFSPDGQLIASNSHFET